MIPSQKYKYISVSAATFPDLNKSTENKGQSHFFFSVNLQFVFPDLCIVLGISITLKVTAAIDEKGFNKSPLINHCFREITYSSTVINKT